MEIIMHQLEHFITELCGICYCDFNEGEGWHFVVHSTNLENDKIQEYAFSLGIDGFHYDQDNQTTQLWLG